MAPGRAAKPRRSLRKRPAAALASRNAKPLAAPEPLAAGQLVFQEDALVAAQVAVWMGEYTGGMVGYQLISYPEDDQMPQSIWQYE